MNAAEQITFTVNLMTSIMQDIVGDIKDGKTPETWDGHELRMLITDRVAQEADAKRYIGGGRVRAYRQIKAERGL